MTSKLSDIISKVQKLLRVAESSNQIGEVAAAQSLAQELITKYQIEEAQLHGHVASGEIVCRRIETPKPYSIDKSVLLNAISKYNFCKVLRGDGYCLIYGYNSDIELCLTLYDILSLHMLTEMRVKLDKVKMSSPEAIRTKAWIKSFFGGYAISISERISGSKNKVIKEAEASGTSVALVVQGKDHAIEEFFQSVNRNKTSARKLTSVSGYQAGVESAKEANLNQTQIER